MIWNHNFEVWKHGFKLWFSLFFESVFYACDSVCKINHSYLIIARIIKKDLNLDFLCEKR